MTHSSQTLGISWDLRVIKVSFVLWMRWFVEAPEDRGWVRGELARWLEGWNFDSCPCLWGEERRGEEKREEEQKVDWIDSGQWLNQLCPYNEASIKILQGVGGGSECFRAGEHWGIRDRVLCLERARTVRAPSHRPWPVRLLSSGCSFYNNPVGGCKNRLLTASLSEAQVTFLWYLILSLGR